MKVALFIVFVVTIAAMVEIMDCFALLATFLDASRVEDKEPNKITFMNEKGEPSWILRF